MMSSQQRFMSAALALNEQFPSINELITTPQEKQKRADLVTTGRTHLMDAMPIRIDQEISVGQST